MIPDIMAIIFANVFWFSLREIERLGSFKNRRNIEKVTEAIAIGCISIGIVDRSRKIVILRF